MVYFLRIDLHLLEIIVEMYSALLVLRPVASPNLEVCTRDVQYFSPSLDRLQWSDACNAAYILQERFLGTDVLNVNLLPLSFISAHMAKCIL